MQKSRFLLRPAIQAIPSTSAPEYLPSKQFMYVKVKRPSQKSHFVKVASEIELFKDIYGQEALKKLKIDDDVWKVLMDMGWEERFAYFVEMREFQEKSIEKVEKTTEKISLKNESLWKSGEMVYARHFHSLLDIYGADFRRQIDVNYGRNMLKMGENLKNFIVDCRFLRDFSVTTQARYTNQMQSLHDENWVSNHPFSINFVNYQADSQLVQIAKRNLLFQYGPPSKSPSEPFRPHPFAPVITSRRVDSVEKKENLLYISPKATRFLPDHLPSESTGIVLCLSNDASPATSSHTAAIADRVTPYRIPFKKFISSEKFRPNSVQLWQMGRIFREYFNGLSIGESILKNMDILVGRTEKRKGVDEKNEVFRAAMHQINSCSSQSSTIKSDAKSHFSSIQRTKSLRSGGKRTSRVE